MSSPSDHPAKPALVPLFPPERIKTHLITKFVGKASTTHAVITTVLGLDGVARVVERRIGLTGAEAAASLRGGASLFTQP